MSNLQLIYDYDYEEAEPTNYYILWDNDKHKDGKIYLIYSQEEPKYIATVSYINNHVAPWYCNETGYMYDSLAYLCERVEYYYDSRERIRNEAIEWQQKTADQNMSYEELAKWSDHWSYLGKEYNLTEEFVENGII